MGKKTCSARSVPLAFVALVVGFGCESASVSSEPPELVDVREMEEQTRAEAYAKAEAKLLEQYPGARVVSRDDPASPIYDRYHRPDPLIMIEGKVVASDEEVDRFVEEVGLDNLMIKDFKPGTEGARRYGPEASVRGVILVTRKDL